MNQYANPTQSIPSAEDIRHEVLRAAREHGTGTFFNEDHSQVLTVSLIASGYYILYNYNFLQYQFHFSVEEFEGRATA